MKRRTQSVKALELADKTSGRRCDTNPKRERGLDFPRSRFGLVWVLSASS